MWLLTKRRLYKLLSYARPLPWFFAEEDEDYLRRFTSSEWVEYELWLYRNRMFTLRMLKHMYKTLQSFRIRPLISIIMPVYNPVPSEFYAAVRSILWQVYPYWELCLVDDCSASRDYLKLLGRVRDRRVRVFFKEKNTGIAETSQYALERSTGDFVALMDQDDELYPDALFSFVKALQTEEIDYCYTDRDMLSPGDRRFMHFFKPGWSPEYLLSLNYLAHFEIYSRDLIAGSGGFRKDYEGSQDYDLSLRVTEKTDKIRHLPMVLYSWRQSSKSVARDLESKAYAFDSGAKSVYDAAIRRGLPVERVIEDPGLWRGHYRIIWDRHKLDRIKVYIVPVSRAVSGKERIKKLFREKVSGIDMECLDADYRNLREKLMQIDKDSAVFFADESLMDIKEDGMLEMLGYLNIDGVGVVGAKLLDMNERIFNVGLAVTDTERLLYCYRNGKSDEKGYGAVCEVPRNVSLVFPSFWGCNINDLKDIGFPKKGADFLMSSLLFFMEMLKKNKRIVCVPYMCLNVDSGRYDLAHLEKGLLHEWTEKGMHDIYYNPNLSDINEDFGIRI